ncbi:MAG TPA: LysM peptidoglycan-binding domain-containing protein [Phycisphaerae bacterium]|nr:LysM peptidoglycan-binding domain-containing protein [Phycisphaerae bacterium]
MTRETRIAMLVGLLFIVMFGLVLSELTGSSSPPAPLTASDDPPPPARKYAPVLDDQAPQPQQDLVDVALEDADETQQAGVVLRDQDSVVEVEVVRSDTRDQTDSDAGVALVDRARKTAVRTYTVKPGDNLIKIARKEYGRQHESQYKRIREANKDRIPNERRLSVGTVLVIPPLPDQAPRAAVATRQRAPEPRAPDVVLPDAGAPPGYRIMDLEELRRSFLPAGARSEAPSPPAPAGRYYTVKQGDNLAKIAREVFKSGSHASVMKLYNANRDKVSDPDVLPVGVRLAIPS